MAGACAGETVVTRVFTASDACGNAATASQVVTVRGRAAPVLTDVPADVAMTCGQALPTALPTASDACDAAPAVTVARSARTGPRSTTTITRVFTATDACGRRRRRRS